MSDAKPYLQDKPAFLVGVSGYLDLSSTDAKFLRKELKTVLWFLRYGGKSLRGRDQSGNRCQLAEAMADLMTQNRDGHPACFDLSFLPEFSGPNKRSNIEKIDCEQLRSTYLKLFRGFEGLGKTPIVLMTNLAPGTDTIAARRAIDLAKGKKDPEDVGVEFEDKDLDINIHVWGVTPYDTFYEKANNPDAADSARRNEIYEHARVFKRNDGQDSVRLNTFRELKKDITELGGIFFTPQLHKPLGTKTREELIAESQSTENDEDRNKRLYAAREYLTEYCHLMICVWNGRKEESDALTSAVAEARLAGPKPNLLTSTQQLTLPSGNPLLHLMVDRPNETNQNEDDPELKLADHLPKMRLLHPYDVVELPEPDAEKQLIGQSQYQSLDEAIELQNLRVPPFNRMADGLSHYNKEADKFCQQSENNKDKNGRDALEEVRSLLNRPSYKKEDAYRNASSQEKKLLDQEEAKKVKKFVGRLQDDSPDFLKRITKIADNRFLSSQVNKGFKTFADQTVFWTFLMTFVAACCLHFFSQSYPDNETAQKASDGAARQTGNQSGKPESVSSASTDENNKDAAAPSGVARNSDDDNNGNISESTGSLNSSAPKRQDGFQITPKAILGVAAFVMVLFALGFFAWRRKDLPGESGDDARALTEGFRVQFYWGLVGLNESVSAKYMQRQRGELDWIRGAIRAVSIPYEKAKSLFDSIKERSLKKECLTWAREAWVEEQLEYYRFAYYKRRHFLNACHDVGGMLALVGLTIIMPAVALAFYPESQEDWTHLFDSNLFIVIAILFMTSVTSSLLLRMLGKSTDNEDDLHSKYRKSRRAEFKLVEWTKANGNWSVIRKGIHGLWQLIVFPIKQLLTWIFALIWCAIEALAWLIPSGHQQRLPRGSATSRLLRLLLDFVLYLPAAIGMGVFLVFIGAGIQTHLLPGLGNLSIVLAGPLLLTGAMLVAWGEKNLYSELSYQYNVMASLFKSANVRLHRELESLDINAADFDEKVEHIQNLFLALGTEALDEHAEWLLLHRARPLEPVLAG